MKKTIILCLASLLVLIGCANYLLYRPDFDDNKVSYYTKSLKYEGQIQQSSIDTIRKKLKNLLELCFVLDRRLLTKSNKYAVLEINLKLSRLGKSIDILEDMRGKFEKGFHLVFSRQDFVVGPLQMQCALEVQYISNFLDIINELRARIAYLEEFRKECVLTSELQEEKLEGVDMDVFRLHKELSEIIYTQIPEYLKNVGIVITRSDSFAFEYKKPEEIKKDADKEAEKALRTSSDEKLLKDVTRYYYDFESEKKEFNVAYDELKASIERFQKTIKEFKEYATKKGTSADDVQLAEQSRQITLIMEEMASRIKNLYSESMSDVNKLLGLNVKVVDDRLWSTLKAETKEEEKKTNFEYYKNNVLELSDLMETKLSMDKENSEAQELRKHLIDLGKSFQEKKGIWGPGYERLSNEWQEKISINRLDDTLSSKLKELETQSVQVVRPFWRTCLAILAKESKEPTHKVGPKGFLVPEAK